MKCLLIILLSVPLAVQSQKIYGTLKEAKEVIVGNQYKASNGWTIKRDDEIQLGKGSMPEKTFAFINEMPNLLTYNQNTNYAAIKLPHTYNGRKVKVLEVTINGGKRMGFYIVAKIGIGGISRYILDIENAIEANEIVVPSEYSKNSNAESSASVSSKADELIKLKSLLNSGAVTQEEYDTEKKKILNRN
jgi:hypothetical protein